MKLLVERPVTVDTIAIVETSPMELGRGTAYPFARPTMTGTNTDLAAVTFTIGGSPNAGTFFGTGDKYNELTIAAAEALTSLSITASAGGKTSAAVTITLKQVGFATVEFTVEDKGTGWAIFPSGGTATIYKTGGNGTVTFTVTNYNPANTYTWYVDGSKVTDSAGSVTFTAAGYSVGYHTVRLVVTIGGVPWSVSGNLGFKVMASKP